MKKIILSIAALAVVATTALAETKKGFLTTKACAEKGHFTDCSLDAYVCGSEGCFDKTEPGVTRKVEFVLFVHNDGTFYNVDTSKFHMSHLDEGVSKNEVTITGEYNKRTKTIVVTEFKAPPPPKKSFFKGCL